MLGIACDPLQHTSMYQRMNEGACNSKFRFKKFISLFRVTRSEKIISIFTKVLYGMFIFFLTFSIDTKGINWKQRNGKTMIQ